MERKGAFGFVLFSVLIFSVGSLYGQKENNDPSGHKRQRYFDDYADGSMKRKMWIIDKLSQECRQGNNEKEMHIALLSILKDALHNESEALHLRALKAIRRNGIEDMYEKVLSIYAESENRKYTRRTKAIALATILDCNIPDSRPLVLEILKRAENKPETRMALQWIRKNGDCSMMREVEELLLKLEEKKTSKLAQEKPMVNIEILKKYARSVLLNLSREGCK